MITGQRVIISFLSLILLGTILRSQEMPLDSIPISTDVEAIITTDDPSSFPPQYAFFIENYQGNGFSTPVKRDLLISLSKLDSLNIRLRYDLREFLEILQLAKEKRDFDAAAMKNLTYAMRKATEQYDRIEIQNYIKALHTFMAENAIYKDRYQSISVQNGTYEILFNEENYGQEEVIVYTPAKSVSVEELKARARGEYVEPEAPPTDKMNDALPEMYPEMGAVIYIKRGDLVFASSQDTFQITGIEGYFLLDQKMFRGQDGMVDWSNFDLAPNEMKARLSNYEFGINQREFKFKNVLFSQPDKIDEPVSGELSLNIRPSRNERGTYPRFTSYTADTPVKGLGSAKLTFTGGITYEGTNFYSRSAYEETSTVEGRLDGEIGFRSRSKDFVFNAEDSILTSKDAELTIYHQGDSIFHPAIGFSYDYKADLMEVETSVPGYKTTPFRSSFYNVDISGDMLTWDLNADSLDIAINSARADVPLMIESKDFYSNEKFQDMAQIFSFHPLIMAVNMSKNYGGTFYTSQMARDKNLDEGLVKKTMELLMARGMVKYDRTSGLVEVLEKGFHYEESGSKNPYYDDILIPSIIGNAPNATLNFKDSVLTVRGVQRFLVSDSLDVVIAPRDGEIKILKNRDVEFNGSLDAGNFQFNGSGFKLKYDSFYVDMEKIDFIKLQIEVSRGKREALSNQLVSTSGKIQINKFDNKSSLKSLPEYPIFTSFESANVYFVGDDILKGAYDSTVYFDIPPFEIDSVANEDPSKYEFKGVFSTGDILPDFKEGLRLMQDKSFGFAHAIPDSGYNLYETGGRLFGELRLDKKGITSPGQIEYLTGSFDVELSTLFLDSLVTPRGIKATLQEGFVDTVSYPSMQAEAYSMSWLARRDSMVMTNLDRNKPFQLFDKRAQLKGEMTLRKGGLFGAGEMNIEGAKLMSDSIAFKSQSFEASHSTLTLAAPNSRKPILSTDNARIDFDVANDIAAISPEIVGSASLEFPFAQFKTSIPSAIWDVKAKMVTMSKPDDIPIEQSFFYSTNKRLDSLAFNGTDGFYDIEKKELNVKGIPFIKVADAKITPEGSELTILENSRIEKLQNAVIIIDTANSYHRLYNAEIEILSRTSFRGRGTYELINAVQDTFSIEFDQFRFVKSDEINGPHTMSSGVVNAASNIRISPGFIYQGEVTMYAYKKALELKGSVKLELGKIKERNIWIEYASNDDIQEVVIPFDQALTSDGFPLNAGIHFDLRRTPYMSFITEKRDPADDDFFVPRGGNLFYDAEEEAYKIENAQKSQSPDVYLAGSMFSYNEFTQNVSFEGKLNFLSGERANNIQAAGKGFGNLDSANYELDATLVMSFGLPVEGLAAMGQNLKEMGEQLGVPRAHQDRSDMIYRVAEFIGNDATTAWDRSYETVPVPLAAATETGELIKDLVISKVHLKWSKQSKAFYSVGKIGVSNVSNIDLNMELDGFVEIRKTPEGDIITVLLEMTDGTWYHFTYDGFSFGSFSSNEMYNATVMNSNNGKTKIGAFKVFMTTIEEITRWGADFKKLYYGIDEPYRLVMAGDSDQSLKKKTTIEGDGF